MLARFDKVWDRLAALNAEFSEEELAADIKGSQKGITDGGVFVSTLIRKQGTTGEVLRALRDGRFTVIYTTYMVVEIIDVLGCPPFLRPAECLARL